MSATALTRTATDVDLAALGMRLSGALAEPGEAGYELATPWNVAVTVAPRAVVAAADAHDVRETVRFAADHGLRVAVQRTGHGACAIDGDDVLLVHTGALDEITLDPAARRVRVGAGVVWRQVMEAAAPHGLMALVGSAPDVGVVGFLTGGGVGPLVRTYGLASDTVHAFELVTGDGRCLRVTADEHADLFWGLRGGKNTLGIVCAVEFDLVALDVLQGGAMYFDGTDAEAVVRAWSTWAPGLPEHANTSLAVLQLPPLPTVPPPLAGRMTVAVRFASTADAATAEALLAPIRAAASPLIDTVAEMSPVDLGTIHSDPVDPMPTHEASALLRELPAGAVDALLAVAGPGSGSPQVVVELRLLGGAYARPGAQASAFCHREAAFSLLSIGALVPPVAPVVPGHAERMMTALEPWSTGGAMPNFLSGSGQERARRCYDEHTRAWLGALADRHDPAGVLRVGPVARAA